ncbi:MAG TPA: hypothetical protein VFE24_03355 [Pirellulales bacterium]|jgi:tetratricopeptide (TPR) repeat protein|nr:hypothetical protein [Pirellulales bacterium]
MISITPHCSLRRALALTALLLVGVNGCFDSARRPEDLSKAIDKAGKSGADLHGKAKLDVVGGSLGDSQEVSLTPDELARSVNDLQTADHQTGSVRWVQRHPEAALALLRTTVPTKPDGTYNLVAAVQDAQCVNRGQTQNWTQMLADAAKRPDVYKAYVDARTRFQASLSQGHPDFALRLDLPKLAQQTGAPMLEIDALQLTGTTEMLNGQPAKAVALFNAAFNLSSRISDYQATYVLLLRSDAQRRAGDPRGASETWRQAVELAKKVLLSDAGVYDPVLWEKLGYLRPIDQPWPTDVVHAMADMDSLPGIDLSDYGKRQEAASNGPDAVAAEIVVWNSIGNWYLRRNQAQGALVCYKRSESAAANAHTQQWLRLKEARALVQLDQTGPATAILVALAKDKASVAYRPACGLLGSIRSKNQQPQQGLALLRKAIEEDETADWPERAEAEADLGLAYLMVGDSKSGLKWLHQAQRRFEADKDAESLVLALENEAAYLDGMKKKNEAVVIRSRIQQIEAGR